MLLSCRKNGLTSLFKEVRVFKVSLLWHVSQGVRLAWFDSVAESHVYLGKSIFWELVDPVVADPVRQDNDKRKQYTNIYVNSLLKYTEGGDKNSQYSYLVVILSNWVCDNWVYRLPNLVPVIFPPTILGPEMAAPILRAPGIFGLFLPGKPHDHITLRFRRGGVLFFGRGGWKCQF